LCRTSLRAVIGTLQRFGAVFSDTSIVLLRSWRRTPPWRTSQPSGWGALGSNLGMRRRRRLQVVFDIRPRGNSTERCSVARSWKPSRRTGAVNHLSMAKDEMAARFSGESTLIHFTDQIQLAGGKCPGQLHGVRPLCLERRPRLRSCLPRRAGGSWPRLGYGSRSLSPLSSATAFSPSGGVVLSSRGRIPGSFPRRAC